MRTGNSIKRCLSIGKTINKGFPRNWFYYRRIIKIYGDSPIDFPYRYKWMSGLASLMMDEFLRDVNHETLK